MKEESNKKSTNKKELSKTSIKIIKIFTFLLWISLFTKWFIFDYNNYIITKYFASYSWYNYINIIQISIKAIFFIIMITLIKRIKWILYIVFYPIILLFWKIPYFVLKKRYWFLALTLVKSIISFFSSFKYFIITISIYILSSFFIFIFSNKIILSVSAAFLIAIVFMGGIKKIIGVFKPSSELKVYRKIRPKLNKYLKSINELDDKYRNASKSTVDDKEIDSRFTKLQTSVLVNRIILFLAKKLKSLNLVNYNVLSLMITILILVIFNIITFSFINFAIYKIDNYAFILNIDSAPKIFSFIYYCFNALFLNSINDIMPLSMIAKIVYMTEFGSAFIIFTIFIGLLVPFFNKKQDKELNIIINDMEKKGSDLESLIVINFNLENFDEAIKELSNAKSSLIKAINYLSDIIN